MENFLGLHHSHDPRQPDVGLGQLFNAAERGAHRCAEQCQYDLLCSSSGSVEGVGEQDSPMKVKGYGGEREASNVLLHPQGLGLFNDKVMYFPFVIQLPPFSYHKEGSSKGSVLVTTDNMQNMVNGK